MTRVSALARLIPLTLALGRLHASPVEFTLTDAKGQSVADAVVSLLPLDHLDAASRLPTVSPRLDAPAPPVEIVQQDREFLPFVTPILAGTTVTFPNRDTVQHHIYSLSKPKKFELPLYRPGDARTVVFDRPGVVVLGCNIHDWMNAYLVVLETPWFAKTGHDGSAIITGAPSGRYRAEIWHPRLAKIETREIALGDDATPVAIHVKLALKPDRRIRRAPNAAMGNYK